MVPIDLNAYSLFLWLNFLNFIYNFEKENDHGRKILERNRFAMKIVMKYAGVENCSKEMRPEIDWP